MHPPKLKPLLLPLLTFAIGLGTGALVFSSPPDHPPPPTDAPAPATTEPAAPDGQPPTPAIAVVSSAPPTAPVEPAPAAPDPEVQAQVTTLMDGWGRMQAELADLRARVASLEQRPTPVTAAPAAVPVVASAPEQQRQALVRAGVPAAQAEEMISRRAELTMQQLELRDQAIREGWMGSDRYREALGAITAQQVPLRDELDPQTYDRFLYESGDDNRVRVTSVIPGSVGADTGLLPGDLIERYADQPIFDYRELRQATSDGVRGELVQVQVRRGQDTLEVMLPRGPIGVQLDATRVQP